MSTFRPLMPRQPVPDLSVALAGGGTWTLSEQSPKAFSMVVVYRGLHCPICRGYLTDLQSKLGAFEEFGVEAVALSSDSRERGEQAKTEWRLDKLPLGYGLSLEAGQSWGLYVSEGRGKTSIGIEEPQRFVEPGLFLIRPDRTLYYASVQTMPFARPSFADMLKAVEFAVTKNYPARGEVVL